MVFHRIHAGTSQNPLIPEDLQQDTENQMPTRKEQTNYQGKDGKMKQTTNQSSRTGWMK